MIKPVKIGDATLYCGDCLNEMKMIKDRSVNLTVTSPPYDNLRSYKGNNELWGEHVWKAVLTDLYRVTKDGGVVVWVVGDATIKGSETGISFKQALYAKECGFNLHDTMIYEKASQPRQNGVRYEQQFEFMFVFSKDQIKIKNPIRIPSKYAGKKVKRTCRDGGKDELTQSTSIVSKDKVKGNIWFYGSKENKTDHPAIFPYQLTHDHIVSWSNEDDMVLDPFMGSGTTGIACAKLGRKFIGIEIEPEYFDIACERISLVRKVDKLFVHKYRVRVREPIES